jgi:hypothetical protein
VNIFPFAVFVRYQDERTVRLQMGQVGKKLAGLNKQAQV